MTVTQTKLITFEQFAAWRPESGRYELHDGVINDPIVSPTFPQLNFTAQQVFDAGLLE